MNTDLKRISWLDSSDMPSRIHLLKEGTLDTLCGGHKEHIENRKLIKCPVKDHGRSKYCKVCFSQGGKSLPWDSRCE